MRKVTFSRAYDHPTEHGHLAYPAGYSGEVSNDTAEDAEKAGRLKADPAPETPAKPAKT